MRVAGFRGVVVLLRTLLLLWTVSDMLETGFVRPPLYQTRQRVQRHVQSEFPGSALAWQHRTAGRNRLRRQGPRYSSGP